MTITKARGTSEVIFFVNVEMASLALEGAIKEFWNFGTTFLRGNVQTNQCYILKIGFPNGLSFRYGNFFTSKN